MKKLIIAMAVIASAIVVNAASVNWTGAGIAIDPDKGAPTSYMAYLVDASSVSLTDMTTALGKGDVSKLSGSAVVKTASTLAVGSTAARFQSVGWGDFTGGTVVDWYTILLNNTAADKATYYLATPVKEFTMPGAGALTAGFGSLGSNWVAMSGPTPTPEPTSGLLLVLGMAGLALRRRRA